MQESNSFSPRLTTVEDFRRQGIQFGERVEAWARDANCEVSGAIREIARRGATAVPMMWAWAAPGGPVAAECFDQLLGMLDEQLLAYGPVDGIVIALHGAMTAVGTEDADGAILNRVRQRLGPKVFIGVSLDSHANVTKRMRSASDVLVGYHTYPHVDEAETGRRTAALVVDSLNGALKAKTVVEKRPMILPAETTGMPDGPIAKLQAIAEHETRGPIRDVTIFLTQPWLDVPELGFSVAVTCEADASAKATRLARELSDRAWEARAMFEPDLKDCRTALRAAEHANRSRPILLVDSADSTGAGATGDSTVVLHELLALENNLNAVLTLVDPEAVAHCHAAGVGAELALTMGGKLDPDRFAPIRATVKVRYIDDGRFQLSGPVGRGLWVSTGPRAVATVRDRIAVMLTTGSAFSYDPQSFRSAGLEPAEADVVVVRSAAAFHAAYDEIVSQAIFLDTPGASTARLTSLGFCRAPRPLYPLDDI
jgi:microcystin degradation protein MlrC